MDLKILTTSFLMIFLAELGDKTQIATMAFSADSQDRYAVFLGSTLALVLSSALEWLIRDAYQWFAWRKNLTFKSCQDSL